MNQREAFLKIFDKGVSYDKYAELTSNDKIKDRMQKHSEATEKIIKSMDQDKLKRLNEKMKVLCIGENWCGDCTNAIPVLSKLADSMENWEFAIAPKAPFEKELNLFYSTAGMQKIPMIIFANDNGDEISRWVERPTRSYRLQADLEVLKLPEEEYKTKYKSYAELKVPGLTEEILREIVTTAERASALIQFLLTKRS